MIYYDHTESRKGTRLPKKVVDAGKPLPNLEMYTGADLLITPYKEKIVLKPVEEEEIIDLAVGMETGKNVKQIVKETGIPLPIVVSAKKFWIACQVGILIQRKSGMDYPNSIQKIDEIFGRMKLWTPDPWLLVSANIGCNRQGKAVVDGRSTKFQYRTLISKKMSWSFNGGSVVEVPRDSLIPLVCDYANKKLEDIEKGDTKYVVRRKWSRQHIVGPNDKRWTWMQVLVDLPGIGNKKAKEVADYTGDLASAIVYLTDPVQNKFDTRPKSVRPSDIKKIRKMFGLADGVKLELMPVTDKDEDYEEQK